MTLDYKKRIIITNINPDSGIISYDFIYESLDSVFNQVNIITKSLNIVNRIPGKGDKMYFLNGVTIPRFKIKKFHVDKGTKCVKYIESSNFIIFSKTTIPEHFDTSHLYTYASYEIITYLNMWIMNNVNKENNEKWAIDFIEEIKANDNNILVRYNYYGSSYLRNKHGIKTNDSTTVNTISKDNYNKIQKILNMKCEFIDESVILNELNTSLVMDSDIYINIQRLLDSSDVENVKLAMEMMANCDYKSSALYLLLLLKDYRHKIFKSSNKNHINFKAMLNYFEDTCNSNFNNSIDEIITILKKKNILIKNHIDVLTPLILEDYNNTVRSTEYKISMITFLDEEGNDIVVDNKLFNKTLETKSEEEVCSELYSVDNDCEVNIDTYKEEIEEEIEEIEENILELDPIIFDELTEIIDHCILLGFRKQKDELIKIKLLEKPSDKLLDIIKFFDKDKFSDHVSLLIKCYLEMK